MNKSQIIGTGAYLPGEPVTVETLRQLIGGVAVDLAEALGARTRYWAIDPATGESREDNSDLGAKAARLAIDNAGIRTDEIDVVISVTCTPDYPLPANGPLIQEKLGIADCAVIELRAGCNGVAQAMTIADQFLKTGTYRTALVIGSELASTYTAAPFIRNEPGLGKNDLLNAVMFGDGAGAAVLRANEEPEAPGIMSTYLGSIGVGKPAGFVLPAGGSKHPLTQETLEEGKHRWVHDYKSISKYDREMAFTAIREMLDRSDVELEDIRTIILPQANAGRIQSEIQSEDNPLARYVDRFFLNVDKVGNTSAAGVLIALDEVNRSGRIRYGDTMMIVGAESSKWLCGGILLKWAMGA